MGVSLKSCSPRRKVAAGHRGTATGTTARTPAGTVGRGCGRAQMLLCIPGERRTVRRGADLAGQSVGSVGGAPGGREIPECALEPTSPITGSALAVIIPQQTKPLRVRPVRAPMASVRIPPEAARMLARVDASGLDAPILDPSDTRWNRLQSSCPHSLDLRSERAQAVRADVMPSRRGMVKTWPFPRPKSLGQCLQQAVTAWFPGVLIPAVGARDVQPCGLGRMKLCWMHTRSGSAVNADLAVLRMI
jgi:hypothetical protein